MLCRASKRKEGLRRPVFPAQLTSTAQRVSERMSEHGQPNMEKQKTTKIKYGKIHVRIQWM
jgi:hypothetical protein